MASKFIANVERILGTNLTSGVITKCAPLLWEGNAQAHELFPSHVLESISLINLKSWRTWAPYKAHNPCYA